MHPPARSWSCLTFTLDSAPERVSHSPEKSKNSFRSRIVEIFLRKKREGKEERDLESSGLGCRVDNPTTPALDCTSNTHTPVFPMDGRRESVVPTKQSGADNVLSRFDTLLRQGDIEDELKREIQDLRQRFEEERSKWR